MKPSVILLLAVVSLPACHNGKGAGQAAVSARRAGDTIIVEAGSSLAARVKTVRVKTGSRSTEFSTSGRVRAIPARYADIASPFAGRVTRSFVRLGQRVAAGSPVFELSSPAFIETAAAYTAARQELHLAEQNLSRVRDLVKNRVGAQKDLDEAEAAYALRRADFDNAGAALRVFRISPSDYRPGRPLIVRSPIAGEVVRDQMVIGQYMKDDAEPPVAVADLSRVWVVAAVKEKDMPLLRRLAGVSVSLVAVPDSSITGEVRHVSELLDDATRSVEVVIECANGGRLMKPGMYGAVTLRSQPRMVVAVPSQAVLQAEEGCYVLVEAGAGRYVRRRVETAEGGGGETLITAGLSAGETIVGSGAFYLSDVK